MYDVQFMYLIHSPIHLLIRSHDIHSSNDQSLTLQNLEQKQINSMMLLTKQRFFSLFLVINTLISLISFGLYLPKQQMSFYI